MPLGTLPPTFVMRVTTQKVWGNAPFQDDAHIEVRGYYPERYTGDASAYANAQFELPLGRTEIFVPVTIGFMAINDVGRVFESGDHSSVWHDGWGGGVYAQPEDRRYTVSLSAVRGTEGTRVYLRFGREL